jgi:hypothetical protein
MIKEMGVGTLVEAPENRPRLLDYLASESIAVDLGTFPPFGSFRTRLDRRRDRSA